MFLADHDYIKGNIPQYFPWFVTLSVDNIEVCIGLLLTSNNIVSKAHCFMKDQQKVEEKRLTVSFGK